jgi:glycosyltransferase involved in cell wall biosynthesis
MINCTVLIMTYNEAANIEKCLDSVVDVFSRICLVDSSSDDETVPLVRKYKNVEIFNNKFYTFGQQRNWLFNTASVNSEYVLFLDADEIITTELAKEIETLVQLGDADFASFPVENKFMGKVIRYAYGHPDVYRLFRTSASPTYVTEGARDYPSKFGVQCKLESPLLHEDLKPLDVWFSKHILNAQREVSFLKKSKTSEYNQGLKTLIRDKVWINIPLSLRPLIYFIYRYIIRGGVLDGYPGFVFCFFQALSYQTMVSTLLYMHKRDPEL